MTTPAAKRSTPVRDRHLHYACITITNVAANDERVSVRAMDGGSRARWQLRNVFVHVLARVARHLERQRGRGRSPSLDVLASFAIEPGEAEGLITELSRVYARDTSAVTLPLDRPDLVAASDLPLARAILAFELTPSELDAVVLAIAAELDSRFGRLVAYLNDQVARTRPTLGLAFAIQDNDPVPAGVLDRPFIRDGLVELEGEGPLSGAGIKVARDVLVRLAADSASAPVAIPGLTSTPAGSVELAQLVLDREIVRVVDAWSRTRERPLVIGGHAGVGRRTLGCAALGSAGLPAIVVELETPQQLDARILVARRETRWESSGLVIRLGPEWPAASLGRLWEALAGVIAPMIVVASLEIVETVAERAPVEPTIITLSAPDLPGRTRLWRSMLPEGALADTELDELAARFEFTPRTIARTIRRATTTTLDAETLLHAAREVGASAISSIAQRLPLVYSRDDLVLPDKLLAELDLAIAWLRHKRHVFETWGFGRRVALGRGLSALFAGPPGTGKTMAAQVLARDLGLDLYRVDLSRVMSKYIGETEKNLSRLFDEARASGAVLFFDEADALFGKRSEVRDAHDRYANVEIGYLLQRMEEHEGAAILATNRLGDLDDAFIRRFHFLLDFPMPDASYRLRLWQGMLPREAEREPGLDFAPLAATYELSGGEIRNCVLAAAYLAAAEGQPVGNSHLERGLWRELRKTGRIFIAPQPRIVHEEV